jgi:hypothetical protein
MFKTTFRVVFVQCVVSVTAQLSNYSKVLWRKFVIAVNFTNFCTVSTAFQVELENRKQFTCHCSFGDNN